MKKNGLTLVEVLVVMAVLSITGIFILNIFSQSLKGSNKTQILGVIKQNGQAVLDTMDNTIRNADNVVCPYFISGDTAYSYTLVTVKDGIYTRYRLISADANNTNTTTAANISCNNTVNPARNSCFVQDNPIKQPISPGVEETEPQLVARICNEADPLLSTAVLLTDNNPQTGIAVNCVTGSCAPLPNSANAIFVRDRSSGFKDQVTIRFIAKPGVSAPAAVAGQIDPVTFRTTINLR